MVLVSAAAARQALVARPRISSSCPASLSPRSEMHGTTDDE